MTFECSLRLALPDFCLDWSCHTESSALGIYGPSGAGKTSLLECLAGWRTPDSGRLVIAGETWFDAAAGIDLPIRERRVGYLPQDVLLFPHLDARANIEVANALFDGLTPVAGSAAGTSSWSASARRERFDDLVDLLEIAPLLHRPVDELSGGERQRIGLARALYGAPRLLLLDEPLTALDGPLKRRILTDLLRLRERFPVPLVLVSHDPLVGLVLCDRIQHLVGGRVAAEAPAHSGRAHSSPPGEHPSLGATPRNEGETALASSTVRGVEEAALSLLPLENILRGTAVWADRDVVHLDCSGLRVVVPQTRASPSSGVTEGPQARHDAPIVEGDRVIAVIHSNEILVATEEPQLISAVNVLATQLEAVVGQRELSTHSDQHGSEAASVMSRPPASELGQGVLLRCRSGSGGQIFLAHVTAGTAQRLELTPGRAVWVLFKAHAVEIVAVVRGERDRPSSPPAARPATSYSPES